MKVTNRRWKKWKNNMKKVKKNGIVVYLNFKMKNVYQ